MTNKNKHEIIGNKKSSTISAMFNSIAGEYDFLNHLLSFGTDRKWRTRTAGYLRKRLIETRKNAEDISILDIACGTGESCIALWKRGFKVTGADISEGMLAVARKKNNKLNPKRSDDPTVPLPTYLMGNAEKLEFDKNSFDAVTIFFGIRNFDKRDECLKEIYRVTKKGGIIAIVEFAKPRNYLFRLLYNTYFNFIMPAIGGLFSKNRKAYYYLAKSVENFPKYEQFCSELQSAGFENINFIPYSLGIAVLYVGEKTENI